MKAWGTGITWGMVMATLIACGDLQTNSVAQKAGDKAALASIAPPTLTSGNNPDPTLTAAKLRLYCRSCHGVGAMRFIYGENDDELFDYIRTNTAPSSGKRWRDAIIEVLSWPTDAPPPAGELMDPANNRDWMPKGIKRVQLANDEMDGRPIRPILIETLRSLEAN